jgi:catechol 2,3-dioxygenase-like lactoylglutathione lyase family enzyme
MAGHWRFLELSLPTPDIAASVDFYRNLGFTELPTTDARRYPYVVFTDGRIALGLHAGVLSAPALSFVQRDVASWARQLEAAGLAVEDQRLGLDDFHEFTLAGPAGHRVVVMEAATFSQPQVDAAPAPLTGVSVHIELGCSDLLEGIEFWRFAGLEPGDEIDADTERLELAAPAVRLQLSRRGGPRPRLCFRGGDAPAVTAAAERFGLPLTERDETWEITAPEGTVLELLLP